MDVQCPDERAAGVICGDDPYKELELYLEKVNEEIGEVFDRWKTSESKKSPSSRAIPIPSKKSTPVPTPRRHVTAAADESVATNGHESRPQPRRRSEERQPRVRDHALTEWSDSFLAEFNGIIARELSELNGGDVEDDQVFLNGDNGTEDMMRIKVCRARSWDNYNVNDSDSSSQGRGTPPPSPVASSISDTSSGSTGNGVHHRASSLARVLRKHRAQIPTACETAEGGAVLVRVASLPDADVLTPSDGANPPLDTLPVPRERNAFSFGEKTSPRINRGDLGRVSFSENNTPKDRRKLNTSSSDAVEIGSASDEQLNGEKHPLALSVDSVKLKQNLTKLNTSLPNEIPTKKSNTFDLEKNSRNIVPFSNNTPVFQDRHGDAVDTTIPDDITIEYPKKGVSQNISKNTVSLSDIFTPAKESTLTYRNQSNDSGFEVNSEENVGAIWDAQADRLKLHEEDNLFFEEVDLDERLAGIPVEQCLHEESEQSEEDDDLEDDLEDVLYTRVHAKRTDDDDHLSGILEENLDSEEDLLDEVLSSSCVSNEDTTRQVASRSLPNETPRVVGESGKDRLDARAPPLRVVVEQQHHRGDARCEQHDLSRSLPDVQTCRSLPPRPSPDMTSSRPGRAPLPAALQSFLTKIRPRRGRGHSPGSPSGSLSPGASPTRGTSSPGGGYAVTIGTQTSPPLSRSSSFTWVSDCSSLALHSPDSDTLDDDNRSSSSSSSSSTSPKDFESYVSSRESPASLRNTDDMGCEFSSRDSLLSSSPPGSADSPERDEEPESGIGTASPPRSKMSGLSHKARRKETWERIRKRTAGRPPRGPSFRSPEVWIRQENVETQTCGRSLDDTSNEDLRPIDSSSGIDDATTPDGLDSPVNGVNSLPPSRPRAVRPQWLAVKPQHMRSTPSPTGYKEPPSPSTASLKMTTTPLPAELASKSSSAPLLMKQPVLSGGHSGNRDDNAKKRVLSQPRSQSERHLAEIEAGEACKWLRAAGFPQYAQMYEDVQFPIDVSGVQKDHPFLDPDSLQSLYRRLAALNRCAKMRVEQVSRQRGDDSDEDDACALSENWTFQPESRRWSRVCDVTAQHQEKLQALSASSQERSSGGNLEEEEEDDDMEEIPVINPLRYGSLPPTNPATGDPDILAVRFRRSGSERLRDGAKALLRRMESLKSRRRKRQHREGVVISGPQVLDVLTMNQRMKDLNCVDVSPVDSMPPGSPFGVHSHPSPLDSSSYCSDTSTSSTPCHRGRSGRREDAGAMSDPESQPVSWRHHYLKDANSNHTKVLEFVDGRSRGSKDEPSSSHVAPRSSSEQRPSAARPGRTGSLNLGQGSQRYRDRHLHSLRRESTGNHLKQHSNEDSSSTLPSQAESDHEDAEVTPRNKYAVVRWHSFQRGSARPDSCLLRLSGEQNGTQPMAALSCGQLLVLRKLALLKLTACMERFCPTHRTGWNWELPKFIRKIKAPDYKDKTVFGVPLLLSLQRTGQALPKCIQSALRWLRVNALDQVGLFRKSGVRSRIQKLKQMTETQGDAISYEGQQAYDVADMVKQYFRELPEALLTNKLSETFIAIFQHVPVALRGEAVQWVLLLLPDEHREALHTLLAFLHQVSARSGLNQMTASNLAVCLAPSLFRVATGGSRSSSSSPRRRKTVGAPDARELAESRAAHDCLLYLVSQHNHLFTVGEDLLSQCHFSYMEQSVPVALEELGAEFQQDWRGYLYACTTALLKEAREKSRGWVSVACPDSQVEMFYRKVGDGHPLRLWRVATEVEAPPLELLQRCLRERHVWDHSLLKWRVVEQLDQQVEVFQYVCANMAPSPAKDFCVVRSWRSDLPKGACVIVETSVEHPDAAVMLGGVRGIVLASRYLIEPCGSGRSRILHLSRVDMKGRTPEWYNKSYGHICALHLSRIRGSFKHSADGPESKV